MVSNSPDASAPAISVVVPFYNEEENAGPLLARIDAAMRSTGQTFEIVAIDDGSRDKTPEVLLASSAQLSTLRVIRFEENSGQGAALYNGISESRGEIIALLDGDGQNPPEEIPALISKLKESGADMVAGYRMNRKDSALRLTISRLANSVRSRFLRDGVRDSGCGLKAFRAEVALALIPIRTLYSFIPALAVGAGFRVVEHPVRHDPRTAGESKYNLRIFLWRPLLDMLGIAWFIRRRFPARIARDAVSR